MVSLEIARRTNASLAQSQPLVACFPGGTSGIGEQTVRSLAQHHGKSGKGLRVYIVGRNASAAGMIISDCSKICPAGEFIFVGAKDLSLLREVDTCCETIMARESERDGDGRPRIDLLVMSHADLHFGGRRETAEGLDQTLSLLFYSRMRFVIKLMPLLRASSLPAHVVSVYAGGLEKGCLSHWHSGDLSLRSAENYYLRAYRTHVTIMTTFFFEGLAKQNPEKLSAVHVYPGLVVTPAFYSASHPLWFKVTWALVGGLMKRFVSIPIGEIGDWILFLGSDRFTARRSPTAEESGKIVGAKISVALSTDSVPGGGAYSVKHTGEENDLEQTYATLRRDEVGEKVWRHVNEAFSAIDRGETFTG